MQDTTGHSIISRGASVLTTPQPPLPTIFRALRDDVTLPMRATRQSAGFDLVAAEEVTVVGGEGTVAVPTGVAVSFNSDLFYIYGRIAMRSGLAMRQHLAVSAGVIDPDYTGEVKVLVYCTRVGHSYTIKRGERFAQLIPTMYAGGGPFATAVAGTPHVGFGSTGAF